MAQILALFFGRQPALSFNRLLPLADLAAGTARGAATPVLPLAGYTDLIVNLHAASDGAQHVLIALNVGGERHDAEHIASVERDFLRVTTRIFSKLAAEPLPTQPLTSREQDILVWVHEGKSNWVIGQIVGVSEHTVKHSVSSILKKYGVLSRRHLPRVQAKTASTM
ncbi:MAG: LuxR C-terminal-related transcriptional regulator [Pseudomonadota bacterium]